MVTTAHDRRVKISITLLRILIGWHFLYEGIVKLYNPEWTSFGYLASAQGPFKSIFHSLTSPSLIDWVDTMNVTALLVVGITFILGIFEKKGALVGIGPIKSLLSGPSVFSWNSANQCRGKLLAGEQEFD